MTPEIVQYGPPASRGMGRDLLSNLTGGCRAAFLLGGRPGAWRPFSEQILLLGLLDLAITFLASFAASPFEGEFHWAGLPRAMLPASLVLAAGWVLARRSRWPGALALVATILLSVLVVFDAVVNVLEGIETSAGVEWAVGGWDVGTVLFLWWAGAAAVAVARAVGGAWRVRFANAGWTIVLVALPLWFVPYVPLWNGPAGDGADAPDAYAGSREDVIYAQPRLMHQVAARLARQRPGIEDLYFVGAAGYAGEDVFLNEVSLAADLVRTRFDAEGRTLVLSNNARTVRTLPVASATSLAQALKAVAQTMDVDEDMLFLFLTTHGSEDHTLAMEFWPLQLAGLTPDMLKRMLDDAGIKWRVIAVSACYAGGFVDPLKDARTLIMTAADAKHQSFGCGTDSELTYFGKAFFDEALRSTFSFTGAFERARDAIARRERENEFTPSNPEMFVGDEIRLKLDRLTRRLEARVPSRWRQAQCSDGARGTPAWACGSSDGTN
ncbi:MAG: C13 family peptidase [Burkholderiales bacterium]